MSKLEVRVKQQVGIINFNYEEIKDNLAQQMELYKDAVFTEDTKQMAKGEVAALRKIKKAIDDKRKEVKAQCLVPYKEFESKANELIKLIDDPINLIDKQIEAFEEKRKAEKKAKIAEIYNTIAGDVADYIPLTQIYNSKWENATTSIKSITEDISGLAESAAKAVETIKAMNSDVVDKALDIYKENLSLTDAITYINNYEQQKAEIMAREAARKKEEEEKKRQAEIERIKAEERERIEKENRIRIEERAAAEKAAREEYKVIENTLIDTGGTEEVLDTLPFEQPSTIRVTYTVVATEQELQEVEMAFNSIGIYFERKDI